MTRRSARGRPAVAAFVLLFLALAPTVALAGVHETTATAAAAKVTITPHRDLLDFTGDGQFVTVDWSGFASQGAAYLRECTRGATDYGTQCSQGGFYSPCGLSCPGVTFLGLSSKDGTGSGIGQVAIGLINATQSLDPIPGKSITCDYQHDCSLFVMPDAFDMTTAIEIPITFATPADACPDGGAFTSGSGGSAGFRMFLGWATHICNPPQNVGLQYTLRPAQPALQDYVDGYADYAVGPLPLDDVQKAGLKAAGRTIAYAPVSASGLVFGFRIVDQRTGNQVTNLTLSPDILAKIFNGKIVQWNDPAIRKLNPGITFPTFIGAITRGDANEESLTLTRWLWADARDSWVSGGERSGIKPNPLSAGPTQLIPSFGQVYLVTGPTAEARITARGVDDFTSTSVYGLIGFMDSSWAAQYDLPTVKIRYDDGTTVAATPQTIANAVGRMTDCGSGLLQPDVSIQDSHVWPMPTVSYMAVPHDAKSSDSPPTTEVADTLASVIDYGVGKGQDDLPAGYVPLTGAMKAQAREVADTMMKGPEEPGAEPCKAPTPPGGGNGTPTPPTGGGPTGGGPTGGGPTGGDPSTTPPGSPSPKPPTTVYVAAQRPPMMLAAARASMILPLTILFALMALVVGTCLLFGNHVTARLAPATARIKRASPRALTQRMRSKRGGP
jgi:ABC-type phosphate transport system substrate-binding protein